MSPKLLHKLYRCCSKVYLLGAATLLLICAPEVFAIASYERVRSSYQSSELTLVDRSGESIESVRIDPHTRAGKWIALGEISPALRQAMILSEDKRFYEHSGVDWNAVSASAWGNLWNKKTRGASTISMQLVDLIDPTLKRQANKHSWGQKIKQASTAIDLEKSGWTKDQILEAYLNLVPLRGDIVGIDALSQTLFGKAAHGLDLRESSVAAALVRSPNAGVDKVGERSCKIFQNLRIARGDATKVDCAAMLIFTSTALSKRAYDAQSGIALHFSRQAMAQAKSQGIDLERLPGRVLHTTLSAPLQRFALSSMTRHLRELSGRNVQDAALVVLDNKTGAVLCWVGSSGTFSQASQVDSVLSMRQPGSTLKPFLYALAIEHRILTAASLLNDSPVQLDTVGALYIPQDYDHSFHGLVSLRRALASSLNVPAVRTLELIEPDVFAQQLNTLGFKLQHDGGYYGYSLALGSADVTLLQLTNAYRTLANAGRWGSTTALQGSHATEHQVMDPRVAFIVGDILSDSNARSLTFGLDSVLRTPFWSAVKTGTSKDMRDNWAIGWDEHYTVGAWVGNANGGAMWNVSGESGAAPMWSDVMNYLNENSPSHATAPPQGLVHQMVHFDHDLEAPRQEWFIAGTQQQDFIPDHAPMLQQQGIVSPTNGTILALDPDIPPKNQLLQLRARSKNAIWQLDGHFLARGQMVQWQPWPGRHVISLVDGKGKTLDRVHLQVRGASFSPIRKKSPHARHL